MNTFGQIPTSPRRVLVADGDQSILSLVTGVAGKEGYEVVTARDGREAYRILQSDANFSTALLEVDMMHIGGADLIGYMRTEKRLMRIPVMLTTSECSPRSLTKTMAARAAVFLPKPFTPDQLRILLHMFERKKEMPPDRAA
jgi:chemosensory pili system protein ChpA (sensor histidine kinase/response regulator)